MKNSLFWDFHWIFKVWWIGQIWRLINYASKDILMMYGILDYMAYVGMILPILCCPGPMTMFCMSNGVSVGKMRSVSGILGGTSAYIFQIFVVLAGITLLQHNSAMLNAVRYIGSLYLAYLGLQYILSRNSSSVKGNSDQAKFLSHQRIYFSGFLIAISNPKSILIYLSIFPQFVDPAFPVLRQYVFISIIFLVLQFISAFGYVILGARLFQWVQTNHYEKVFYQWVGTSLLLVAIMLVVA